MDELARQIFRGIGSAFAVPALVLMAASELGYRLGIRVNAAHDAARKKTIGGIQGAILGLLGLLLGFTFAMATSRYDARRLLVVKEANAIGTTFLRASFLPEAHIAPVEDLLRRYVALRLDLRPVADDPAKLAEALGRSAEIQRQLWAHAVAATKEAPSITVGAFINALNETIDTEAERLSAARADIPGSIWTLLLVVASLGCLTSSYAAGAEGARSTLAGVVFPLLVAVVIMLIFDLMHPTRGFIGVDYRPLIDLQQSIAPPHQ